MSQGTRFCPAMILSSWLRVCRVGKCPDQAPPCYLCGPPRPSSLMTTTKASKPVAKGVQRTAGFVGHGQRFCFEELGSECVSQWLQGATEVDRVHADGRGPVAGGLDRLDQAAGSGLGHRVVRASELECQDDSCHRINSDRHLGKVRARRLAYGHWRVEGGEFPGRLRWSRQREQRGQVKCVGNDGRIGGRRNRRDSLPFELIQG